MENKTPRPILVFYFGNKNINVIDLYETIKGFAEVVDSEISSEEYIKLFMVSDEEYHRVELLNPNIVIDNSVFEEKIKELEEKQKIFFETYLESKNTSNDIIYDYDIVESFTGTTVEPSINILSNIIEVEKPMILIDVNNPYNVIYEKSDDDTTDYKILLMLNYIHELPMPNENQILYKLKGSYTRGYLLDLN